MGIIQEENNFYKDRSDMFNLKGLLDIEDFIKKNDVKEISNPIFFNQNKLPTSDGLLSNEIFGITKEERANRFGYIDLHGTFLHPLVYKVWSALDKNVKSIVHGIDNFVIDSNGQFKQDPNGKTGIKFLKDNINKIKIRSTDSTKRDRIIEFLNISKPLMFITKYPVIPAFYRDVNTEGGKVGVGDINKYYNSIIIASKALAEAQDYGLSISNSQAGRMQEILLQVYNYFGAGNPDAKGSGVGMPSKFGIIRRANLSKTTDYSSRLVITSPELKVEKLDDIEADMDYSVVPLASLSINFLPYMIFWLRNFFENEFSTRTTYTVHMKDGKIKEIPIQDYQIAFSDERIKDEINRFAHGYSNRFIPIKIPTVDKKLNVYMHFKGKITSSQDAKDNEQGEIINRRLTWCDLLFMAASEVTADKHILITRYPIDSFYNQFPTKVKVQSTIETEPMLVNSGAMSKFYKKYPKIREEDIEKDTSNKFIDSLNLCNGYLDSIGGDYDGDQVSVKGIYSAEANAELDQQMNSKIHYIGLDGISVMDVGKEAKQSLYCLTMVLPNSNLTDPQF